MASLEEPISSNEVWYRLLKIGNPAPGPDGISYQKLRMVDPNASILTKIFQACFQMRALSKAQKDFMEFEGCLEHNFVVQSAIEETRRTSRQACFSWLDLENALGSVAHEHIFNVLNVFGVPKKIITIFRDMYTDSSTSIKTPLEVTSRIPFKRGVKQGCPGNLTLFNVAKEKIDAAESVYPRLNFILRGTIIRKPLSENQLIMRLGKKRLGLPQRVSNEVLFFRPFKGGAGMMLFSDSTDLAKIQHAFRLLMSRDS
ncbi:hypothetical protein LAZ67_13001542 [Cordylochernes scorpioides]|uniref:Reverse transcriptase domain-containing protein n=1 Tax=Cordylochernes scorpioides TaxID=51811 RepID=A0ABY6L3X2_9ARAC|nr:hypothetical protein LAZ67_13001542 [Cordylochernes scorpioides]